MWCFVQRCHVNFPVTYAYRYSNISVSVCDHWEVNCNDLVQLRGLWHFASISPVQVACCCFPMCDFLNFLCLSIFGVFTLQDFELINGWCKNNSVSVLYLSSMCCRIDNKVEKSKQFKIEPLPPCTIRYWPQVFIPKVSIARLFYTFPYHTVIKSCICVDLHMRNVPKPFFQQHLPKKNRDS